MEQSEFLEYLRQGNTVIGNSDLHLIMHKISQQALEITSELNSNYHSPEKMREIFSKLTGKEVDKTFGLFPPFYSECGKNIFVGKDVFINCGCHFQDQGGIYIDDGALIGSEVVMATLNHSLKAKNRHDLIPSPIHIGKNVWIGSHATILPGVTIGDNSVIAAGATVTKNVPSNTVYGGTPAKFIKNIPD